MVELRWDGNDFRNSQDSSGTVADNISRNGKLQQGYKHGSLTEGLVAYYPMEKGEGEVLHDGAFDNLGQIKGASWDSESQIGNNSLSFDGDSDYIDATGISTSGDFTVSWWMNRDDISETSSNESWILDSSNGRFIISVDRESGNGAGTQDTIDIYDGGWVGSSTTTNENQWVLVTLVMKSANNETDIYVNGTFKETISAYNNIGGEVSIGSRSDGGNYFYSGLIDDVRIYDRALSEPEIKALHDLSQPSGIEQKEKDVPGQNEGGISRYKLNGNADDAWSNNHGTNNGADLTTTGVHGQAAKFKSSNNEYINTSIDSITPPLTISMWVKSDLADGSSYQIFSNYANGSDDLVLQQAGTDDWNLVHDAGGANIKGNKITTGEWIHLTGIIDGSKIYLYENGKLTASDTDTDTSTINSGNPFNIARGPTGGNYFDGKIDDVRIYNQALTPLQVEKLYHKGAYRISRDSTLH